MAWNVVIAGGGFGGLYAARRLERVLPRGSARVQLVTPENFLLYTPLLPGAAAGTLEPRHVVVPLRESLAATQIRLGRVVGADPGLSEVHVTTADGREAALRYDHLIVAVGSVSRVLRVPGLAEHGMGFKTISEAIALRNRALQNLEVAESLDDADARRSYLTFVFVGAGYAGLEGIAELQDYVADVVERYPRCRLDGTRWILVEALDRVMPEIDARLAGFATRELRARGIDVRTGTRLARLDENEVWLSTGERIPARTLCWTAGVKPPQLLERMGLELDDDRRIRVDRMLRAAGRENVWAIGDAAAVPDPAADGARPSPPTAQHAIRQGRLAADNVAAALGGRPPKPFRYKTRGVFVDMGRHKAVAEVGGIRMRGFPAWFAARTYHLMMAPGVARRLRLVADWTVGLLFGRDAAELGQLGHPPSLGGYMDTPGSPRAEASDAADETPDPAP
ncbi:MAG: NAD(P)/FAD-dependent oxidoreductase [Thermoleophilaceae bacterium]|nr:NAD(P)/FAD-dependent oxidoreductase [Thermoleophilaceae bacterium]